MNTEFNHVLLDLWRDLQQPEILWQIGTLTACLVLAWLVSHLIRLPRVEQGGAWKLGVDGLKRLLFPLVALLLVLIVRPILAQWHHVNLLHVAVPLLGSMALIRVLFYALRQVLAPGSLLAGFERLTATLVWGVVALHIVGALPAVREFLAETSISVGMQKVSLLLVLQAVFWVLLTLLAALWAASTIESRLMRADTLHTNLKVVFARLSRALLVLLAVLIALPMVGIDLTVLSVFGGALGVGLGFGLQKIASNYVSGFIILLDRSTRIGDYISVNNFYGRVKDITTRYVVLRGGDGLEAIVPNEQLITATVVSNTYSDSRVRLAIQVQVGYDVDVERALVILRDVAAGHERVLDQPAPSALLLNFADSGINLELGFWIGDPESGKKNVRSEISREVLLAFRRENIEIPFPRRDIRIISENPPEVS